MSISTYFLILSRQIGKKWGRFLLASGGIMIGVWAVMLTSGLSFGLQQTLVGAINSRAESRYVQVQKSEGGEFGFDINNFPKFKGISEQNIIDLKNENNDIVNSVPSLTMDIQLTAGEISDNFSCTEVSRLIDSFTPFALEMGIKSLDLSESDFDKVSSNPRLSQIIIEPVTYSQYQSAYKNYTEKCSKYSVTATDFSYLLDTTRSFWSGKTENLNSDEIVVCFRCGDSIKLNEKFGVSGPNDLIGKKITIEYDRAPTQYVFGEETYDVFNRDSRPKPQTVPINNKVSYTIAGVIDDREDILSIGFSNFYLPLDNFTKAIELANPDALTQEPKYIEYSLFVNDYSNLKSTVDFADSKGYTSSAIALILVEAVNGAFAGVSVVLLLFSLISFIASTFGIVSIMTISVLERKKEIGILKSLGARDSNIFGIFFVESIFLGILGWIMGVVMGLLSGALIAFVFEIVIQTPDIAKSLEFFNITKFSPIYPWYIYVGTLIISVVFTALSGLFPSIRAAKEDPVEVLRGE